MKTTTYRRALAILLVSVLAAQIRSEATQMPNTPDQYNDTTAETAIENSQLPQNLSGANLTTVKLPQELSGADLTNANLTGQRFTHTNFKNAQLEGAILTDTTCDYQQCFQDNVKMNKLSDGEWYLDNLPKYLKSIAQVYPAISQNRHKVELLQIASGLAYLPYYQYVEFYIKAEYWSCKLLLLKEQLGPLGKQLVCSLARNLEYDAKNLCWHTNYPYHLEHLKALQIASQWCTSTTATHLPRGLGTLIQHYVTEPPQTVHDNFDQYLQTFQEGLIKYNVKSEDKWGYDWYKATITQNIQGLQKTYPKLTSPKLRKEAIDIAFQLSEKYKIQHMLFLLRYLSCQNRLIHLKISVGIGAGNDIHYSRVGFGSILADELE